jgi:sulfatase modifying factor 1
MRAPLFSWLLCCLGVAACGKAAPPESTDAAPSPGSPPASASANHATPRSVSSSEDAGAGPAGTPDAVAAAPAEGGEAGKAGETACPNDMAHVDEDFCPDVDRQCVDMEHEETNHLDICHAFAPKQRCRVPERHISFCVDRYEYPNVRGAHPVWMLNWYQAQATCESKGKRLCWASEWTAACEGPERTPFPYGWERDHDKCNADNFYIEPAKAGPSGPFFFYSKDSGVAERELARLDQSVPSGSMESCRSAFGVYDMPGNFDEWVVSDQPPHEKSQWAGLKGGAWGHVRSQCRPMTFSHDAGFQYYFVSFRCCRDAAGQPSWTPSPGAVAAPVVEAHDFAPDAIRPSGAPGPSKTKYTRTGHRE